MPLPLACGLIAGALLLSGAPATANGVPASHAQARAAKVEALNETLTMNITKIKGNTIYASGHSSGAITGSGLFYMTLINATHAKAEMNGGNSHGNLHCAGAATYRVSGAVSYFSGVVTTFAGSRGYASARNLGISFSGDLNRTTYTVSVKLHGKWNS